MTLLARVIRLAAPIIALIAISAPGELAAQPAKNEPLALVRSFYVADYDMETMPLSMRLRTLLEQAEEKAGEFRAPVSGLMHDWTYGVHDPENPPDDGWQKKARVAAQSKTANNATVIATFDTGSGRQEVTYDLLREDGRWVVDEIVYRPDGEKLSEMLEAGARGERN